MKPDRRKSNSARALIYGCVLLALGLLVLGAFIGGVAGAAAVTALSTLVAAVVVAFRSSDTITKRVVKCVVAVSIWAALVSPLVHLLSLPDSAEVVSVADRRTLELISLRAGIAFLVMLILAVVLAIRSSRSILEGLINCVIALCACSILGSPFIYMARPPRSEELVRQDCGANLRLVAQDMECYQIMYAQAVPPYELDDQGQPMHSWRVLLPGAEAINHPPGERPVYDLSEAWNGPGNRRALNLMPWFYRCPEDTDAAGTGITSYVAILRKSGQKIPEMVAVVELANSGIQWTEPRDLTLTEFQQILAEQGNPSSHSKGFNVLWLPEREVEFVTRRSFHESMRDREGGNRGTQYLRNRGENRSK